MIREACFRFLEVLVVALSRRRSRRALKSGLLWRLIPFLYGSSIKSMSSNFSDSLLPSACITLYHYTRFLCLNPYAYSSWSQISLKSFISKAKFFFFLWFSTQESYGLVQGSTYSLRKPSLKSDEFGSTHLDLRTEKQESFFPELRNLFI